MRPSDLAQDDTPGVAPAIHALEALPGYDAVLLLQPTSPLRNVADIDGFIAKALDERPVSMASVYPTPKNPYWMYTLDASSLMQPIMGAQTIHRRQDMPPIYATNGALYWAHAEWLKVNNTFVTCETTGYIMPAERSVDLDSPVDWQLAELLMQSTLADSSGDV